MENMSVVIYLELPWRRTEVVQTVRLCLSGSYHDDDMEDTVNKKLILYFTYESRGYSKVM